MADKKTYTVYQNPFKNLTPKAIKTIKALSLSVIIIILLIIIGSSCWYTISDKQNAVITTFGKVTSIVEEPGIHLKIPFGIQKAHKVDTNVYQKIYVGYTVDSEGKEISVDDESKMITGDFNIVNIDFYIEYKVTNPEKYLYASENPETILKNLVQSQVRNVVSSYDVDDVLTTKKSEIQAVSKELITKELELYDIGLMLIDVKIQDAEAPTPEVIAAFKSVETAKQGAETALNEAKAYENAQLPEAQAKADKLIQNAEFLKQNRINEAKEEISMFEAMYTQYSVNPEITKKRMYYEAIETILPKARIYINTNDSGTSTILPLESITGSSK